MDSIAFGVLAALCAQKATAYFKIISTIFDISLIMLVFVFRKVTSALRLTHWNIQVSLLKLAFAFVLIVLSQY